MAAQPSHLQRVQAELLAPSAGPPAGLHTNADYQHYITAQAQPTHD
jgi:hypothetical protein